MTVEQTQTQYQKQTTGMVLTRFHMFDIYKYTNYENSAWGMFDINNRSPNHSASRFIMRHNNVHKLLVIHSFGDVCNVVPGVGYTLGT